ncbi:MAG: alanine racemase [Pseudomonadota bacterium]
MAQARLTVDLGAIARNWRALAAMNAGETAAVVKADAYGLGADQVAPVLAAAGAKTFFVALAEEGAALREAIGEGPRIFVFSGLMPGDEPLIRAHGLIPLLNSPAQAAAARAMAAEGPCPVGLQLDTGMNRLGLEPAELETLIESGGLDGLDLALLMSHLACADEPDHPQNEAQRAAFEAMTAHPRLAGVPRSLAATGGALLDPAFHYDLTRPGVGLYGGLPFAAAEPVVKLEAPVIQVREVSRGEAVGYGAAWRADAPRRIATVSAGYADGLIRRMGDGFEARIAGRPLPSAGRVSMDLVTFDATDAPEAAEGAYVELLGAEIGVDDLAARAGTIGYEILTALGARYERRYAGGA